MEKLSIGQIKKIELDIMLEIDCVCRDLGITYFLGYGSCLGAVRHKGFIPWDDDIDIVMFRKDYERFFSSFEQSTRVSKLKLVSYRDGKAIFPFLKVVDSSTLVVDTFASKEYSTGIWVDIFPLDFAPPPGDSSYKRSKRLELLRNLIIADPAFSANLMVKVGKRVSGFLLSGMNANSIAEKIDRNARDANKGESDFVADLIGEYKAGTRYAISLFEPIDAEFEGCTFTIPKYYDEYLTMIYGDWRMPPDINKRFVHIFEAYRL